MSELVALLAKAAGRWPYESPYAGPRDELLLPFAGGVLVAGPESAVEARPGGVVAHHCGVAAIVAAASALADDEGGPSELRRASDERVRAAVDDPLHPLRVRAFVPLGVLSAEQVEWPDTQTRLLVRQRELDRINLTLAVPGEIPVTAWVPPKLGGLVALLCDLAEQRERAGQRPSARRMLVVARRVLEKSPSFRDVAEKMTRHAWDRFGGPPDRIGSLSERLRAVVALGHLGTTPAPPARAGRSPAQLVSPGGAWIVEADGHMIVMRGARALLRVWIGVPDSGGRLSWAAHWMDLAGLRTLLARVEDGTRLFPSVVQEVLHGSARRTPPSETPRARAGD
jgi:hypothetical protein